MTRAEQLLAAVGQGEFRHLDSLIHVFVGGSELHGAKVVWSTAGNERRNGPDDMDVCLYSLRKWAG